jgi:hypothetical protein
VKNDKIALTESDKLDMYNFTPQENNFLLTYIVLTDNTKTEAIKGQLCLCQTFGYYSHPFGCCVSLVIIIKKVKQNEQKGNQDHNPT